MRTVPCHLCEVLGAARFTKSREGVQGEVGSYLIGTEFLFCKLKGVLERDGGDGCTTCQGI